MNWEGKEQGSGKGVTRQLHNVTGIDERVMVSDRVTRLNPYSKTEGGGGGFLKIYNGTRRDDGVGCGRLIHFSFFKITV
jgi:hypothetical protein